MNEERVHVRMTVPRMAEGIRMHMQMKEKFLAVMEEADLPAQAVEQLEAWLKEWKTDALHREIAGREEAARQLEQEIAALRRIANTEPHATDL